MVTENSGTSSINNPSDANADDAGLLFDPAMLDEMLAEAQGEESTPKTSEEESSGRSRLDESLAPQVDFDAVIEPAVHKGDELIVGEPPALLVRSEHLGQDAPISLNQADQDALLALAEVDETVPMEIVEKPTDEVVTEVPVREEPPTPLETAPASAPKTVPEASAVKGEVAPRTPEPETVAPGKATPAFEKVARSSQWPARMSRLSPILPKLVASLSAGAAACFVVGALLTVNQERVPDAVLLADLSVGNFTTCVSDARVLDELGSYTEAAERFALAIERASSKDEKVDAMFMRIEEIYKALGPVVTKSQADEALDAINEFIDNSPEDIRVADAKRYKASVYKSKGMLRAAYDVFKSAIPEDRALRNMDAALMDVARLAVDVGKHDEAAGYLTRLLDEYPQSPLASEATLMLADAYGVLGYRREARAIYADIARSNSPLGARALVSLGKMAFDEGKYAESVSFLEAGMGRGDFDGRDQCWLFLAQAYYGAGRLADARTALNDLLAAFPESTVIPAALYELSRVLDDMGMRSQAEEVAQNAAAQFPNDAGVLRSLAKFQADSDRKREAADTLMKAVDAGASDPELLLTAAQYYRSADALLEAKKTCEKTIDLFPRTAQGFLASVELAEILYQEGRAHEAIQRLERLSSSASGPQLLPLLVSLARMYGGLGLKDREADVSGRIAELSLEPSVLAQAALSMFDSASDEQGLAIAKRVDIAKVDSKTAFALLKRCGKAAAKDDVGASIGIIEKAYKAYPGEVTPKDELELLGAYLSADKVSSAQELVSGLNARAQSEDIESRATALRAAVLLADFLYEKGDFRTAAQAYALAVQCGDKKDVDVLWAKYQRANALLGLSNFEEAIKLYDEVAASGSSWAVEARIKASNMRTQQRLGREKPGASEPK